MLRTTPVRGEMRHTPMAVAAALGKTASRWTRCSSTPARATFAECADDGALWDRIFAVNVEGPYFEMQASLPSRHADHVPTAG